MAFFFAGPTVRILTRESYNRMFNQKTIDHLTMILPLLLQMGGLTFAVFSDSYISKKRKRVMLIIIFFALSLIAQNYFEMIFAAGKHSQLPRTLYVVKKKNRTLL